MDILICYARAWNDNNKSVNKNYVSIRRTRNKHCDISLSLSLSISLYIYTYMRVNKLRTILERNPDKSRNLYRDKINIINPLYFYRAQRCVTSCPRWPWYSFILSCLFRGERWKRRCVWSSSISNLFTRNNWVVYECFPFFGGGFRGVCWSVLTCVSDSCRSISRSDVLSTIFVMLCKSPLNVFYYSLKGPINRPRG